MRRSKVQKHKILIDVLFKDISMYSKTVSIRRKKIQKLDEQLHSWERLNGYDRGGGFSSSAVSCILSLKVSVIYYFICLYYI